MGRKEFKSCPVCNEKSDQCLSCASYVVNGERIYYEKLINFGASNDSEVRFIRHIQKHSVKAFSHNGKLYIPSRQGRSVPLAIGLQWRAWQEQQKELNQAYEDIETFSTGMSRESEFKVQFANQVKEQQKVIDELESKITDLNKNLKDRELVVLVRQEIIDSALTVLKSLKSENDLWGCDQVSVQIDLLEKVLKGGNE